MKNVTIILGSLVAILSLAAGCVRRDNPTIPETPLQGLISTATHQYDGITGSAAKWNVFPSRRIAVFNPPGYDFSTVGPRFPVLYLLPGFDGEPSFYHQFGNEFYYEASALAAIASELIANGEIKPLFIVMPDAAIFYGGSFFADNNLAGQWETMMGPELVEYADQTSGLRTLQFKESRAISGHSSGGYGAVRVAMKYPDVYNSLSAIDAPLSFADGNFSSLFQSYLQESSITTEAGFFDTDTLGFRAQGKKYMVLLYSVAATFSPGTFSNATRFGRLEIDLPFNYQGQIVPSTWQRWLDNDLAGWLDNPTYANALREQNLYFESSDNDLFFFNQQTVAFVEKLHDLDIEHTDVEFGGYSTGDNRSRGYLYDRLAGILKFHDRYLRDRDGNY